MKRALYDVSKDSVTYICGIVEGCNWLPSLVIGCFFSAVILAGLVDETRVLAGQL